MAHGAGVAAMPSGTITAYTLGIPSTSLTRLAFQSLHPRDAVNHPPTRPPPGWDTARRPGPPGLNGRSQWKPSLNTLTSCKQITNVLDYIHDPNRVQNSLS